jgi:hypothetical protein
MLISSPLDCSSHMPHTEVLRGVPGILMPFKEFIESKGLKQGAQIVHFGVPGTCTPFIELLGFAIRGLFLEQVFVPMVDESKVRKIAAVPDIGMQVGPAAGLLNPRVLVIMGGHSMPNVPVQAEQVKSIIDKCPGAAVLESVL